MDQHAQQEIRDYACAIGQQIVAPLFPIVWEAFLDYRQGAMELTRLDAGVIARLMETARTAQKSPPFEEADFLAAQDESWKSLTRSRERDECREKLRRLMILP
jgi:thymidylate synthase (FAD)